MFDDMFEDVVEDMVEDMAQPTRLRTLKKAVPETCASSGMREATGGETELL